MALTRIAGFCLCCCAALVTLVTVPRALAQSPALLGDGDQVRITVFQNPDLTTETRISERGSIAFPLLGEVQIAGLTPEDAAARIAQQLTAGKFVVHPQVSVNVLQVRSRQVSVLGEVARPGRYVLDESTSTLTDLLAQAGGITADGDDHVLIVRNRAGKEVRATIDVSDMYRTGDMSQNVRLENGDVIYVRRAPQFYVYGEVQRAGAYRLQPAMTVMQALSLGGGLTPRGTLHGLQIQRRTAAGHVDTFGARPTDLVRADDVIVVRERLF